MTDPREAWSPIGPADEWLAQAIVPSVGGFMRVPNHDKEWTAQRILCFKAWMARRVLEVITTAQQEEKK